MSDSSYHYRERDSIAEPWKQYAQWRQECPVTRTDAAGGYWLLTRFDDIVAAACDTATFSSAGGVQVPRKLTPAPLIPFETDPPRHVKLRAILMRHFTNRALAAFPALADAVCGRLAAGLAAHEQVDLMAAYAYPVSCLLFAEHVGIPRDEQEQTLEWLRAWTTPPYDPEALGEGLLRYDAFLTELGESGRAREGSFLAAVERAAVDGTPLTELERRGLRFTMLLAGVETTLYALGNAVLLLDSQPRLRAQLIADLDLVPAFVEEALRLAGPAEGHSRTVTRSTEVSGQLLEPGDHVLLLWASGSRDRDSFPAGVEVDVGQASTRHLGFGVGPHRCAGAPLARIELTAALRALLVHVPDFQVDPDRAVAWHPNTRGPMTLPFRPAPLRSDLDDALYGTGPKADGATTVVEGEHTAELGVVRRLSGQPLGSGNQPGSSAL
jgi:cytochrome P450